MLTFKRLSVFLECGEANERRPAVHNEAGRKSPFCLSFNFSVRYTSLPLSLKKRLSPTLSAVSLPASRCSHCDVYYFY